MVVTSTGLEWKEEEEGLELFLEIRGGLLVLLDFLAVVEKCKKRYGSH